MAEVAEFRPATTIGKHKIIKFWKEDHNDDYVGQIYNPKVVFEKLRYISCRWNAQGQFMNWHNTDYNIKIPNGTNT